MTSVHSTPPGETYHREHLLDRAAMLQFSTSMGALTLSGPRKPIVISRARSRHASCRRRSRIGHGRAHDFGGT